MSNIVHLFSKATEEHHQERRKDNRDRRLMAVSLASAMIGVLLFGALCFDIGLHVGRSLSS